MTQNSLLNILKTGENLHAEFKLSFQKELIESVVAFANAKGGHIYIGVSDDPKIIVDIKSLEITGKKILDIEVDEYPIKPVSYKGRYYKRRNNSNHQMTAVEISNTHLKTVNSSWDYFPDLNHTLVDIDEENISKFIKMANIQSSIEEVYTKFELVKNTKITNACYLLFNNNDKSLFTNIEIGRFQTETLIKDSLSVHGGIINQVEILMEFIYKHINKAYVISGKAQRDEVWDYPMDAIREIVVNMIVHRDYISNIHSVVKIFDDRIEFYNHGMLPDGLSIEDVKSGKYKSMPRNLQIADIFKTANIIEKYGSGIKRVIKLFKEHGSKEPLFENRLGGMIVVAYKKDPFTQEVINEPLSKMISLISNNVHITKEELEKETNLSRATITRYIKKLKAKNLLKRVGSDKSGYWEVLDAN